MKCTKCENLPDRSPKNELCKACSAFSGSFRFFNTKELNEKKIYSLPQADEYAIRDALDNIGVPYKWVDQRPIHKMKYPIKFVGKLYTKGDLDDWGNPRPDQRKAALAWWKKKVGVIQAPARSGKTVIATALYCATGVRTVIIANKKELLNQFYETATGKAPPLYRYGKFQDSTVKAQRSKTTNIDILQRKTGRQIYSNPIPTLSWLLISKSINKFQMFC